MASTGSRCAPRSEKEVSDWLFNDYKSIHVVRCLSAAKHRRIGEQSSANLVLQFTWFTIRLPSDSLVERKKVLHGFCSGRWTLPIKTTPIRRYEWCLHVSTFYWLFHQKVSASESICIPWWLDRHWRNDRGAQSKSQTLTWRCSCM